MQRHVQICFTSGQTCLKSWQHSGAVPSVYCKLPGRAMLGWAPGGASCFAWWPGWPGRSAAPAPASAGQAGRGNEDPNAFKRYVKVWGMRTCMIRILEISFSALSKLTSTRNHLFCSSCFRRRISRMMCLLPVTQLRT